MLNLNSTIDLDFKQFLRWWKRELTFLIPEKAKQLLTEKQGFIIISPDGNHLTLTYLYNEHSEQLATLVRNELGITQFTILQEKDERLTKAKVILKLPSPYAIQKELSLLIKDDTWLNYLQYSDGHLQIQGESAHASSLIAVLEASELFAHVRFASPVTQDAVSKLERFQITLDVIPAGVH